MKKALPILGLSTLASIVLGLTLIVVFSVFAKPTLDQEQAIVQIFVVDSNKQLYSSGSGVIIDDFPHILTNYHVIEPAIGNSGYTIFVCFTISDKEESYCGVKATLVKAKSSETSTSYEELFDLALLDIPTIKENGRDIDFSQFLGENNISFSYVNFDHTNFSYDPVDLGDKINILGYPAVGGATLTYTEGTVSGFETIKADDGTNLSWKIKTDAKINPGNSGGGAFDSDNNFIGVPQAVAGGDGNIGYIISLPVVNLFLSEIHIQYCDSNVGGSCVCKYGYYPDSTATKCVKDQSITNSSSINYQPKPELTVSVCGSSATLNPDDNKCYCNKDFFLNEAENACISPDAKCQELNGSNSHAFPSSDNSGSYDCYCDDGYTFEGGACVLESVRPAAPTQPTISSQTSEDIAPFIDFDNNTPYQNAIRFVKKNGYMTGYPDGTFGPNNKINRAEFTKILMQVAFPGQNPANTSCFKDVHSSDWFAPFVCLAKEKNVISGYKNGLFKPTNNIKVSEALKITLEIFYTNIPNAGGQWYQKYWDYASNKMIMPNTWADASQDVTRAEMAQLIYKIKGP